MHDELKMVCTALDQLISIDSAIILAVAVVIVVVTTTHCSAGCSICWCTSVCLSVSHICDDFQGCLLAITEY